MKCGECGRRIVGARKRCMYCGGAAEEASGSERPAQLSCPSCEGAMEEVEEHGVVIDRCLACRGVWYDRGELEAAVQAARLAPQLETASDDLWSHLPGAEKSKPPPTSKEVRYRPCPICRETMLRNNHKKRSGVIIDVCRLHGVFLDEGELERIVEFETSPAASQPPPEPKKPRPGRPVQRHQGHQSVTDHVAWDVGVVAVEVIASVLLDW